MNVMQVQIGDLSLLTDLWMRSNVIADLHSTLSTLATHTPNVTTLRLEFNAACGDDERAYQAACKRALPALERLDAHEYKYYTSDY